jgi:transcription antitermination factor NusG
MKANLNYFVWVVAYIDATYINKVHDELARHREYAEIEACIPTIKILKKSFKGKQQFEHIPLMFNYGFFKIPRKFALSKNYMDALQRDVSCIFGWVKDPAKVYSKKPTIRMDGEGPFKNRTDVDIEFATATGEEVAALLKDNFNYSAHDKTDIDKLKLGQIITLHGYPWDGLEAEVKEINEKSQEVKVEIRIFNVMKGVTIGFDNIFFSVYHKKNYDDSVLLSSAIEFSTSFDKKRQKGSSDE